MDGVRSQSDINKLPIPVLWFVHKFLFGDLHGKRLLDRYPPGFIQQVN